MLHDNNDINSSDFPKTLVESRGQTIMFGTFMRSKWENNVLISVEERIEEIAVFSLLQIIGEKTISRLV